ncbi:Hsp20/alpha crystallin family protein [Larkinella rosea]|uniref:Hsp20/alpha crystallin family protein n=1 Tax=Larkinella rosea TaxID=2025312 RepID=A0A3P1C3I2_9BACT|nr:Hsp20/alpha crystallin family protein [Larkinella rosea]RRB07842.1 Hsp20/alpha crystallin family protein [Larkinella rosea]
MSLIKRNGALPPAFPALFDDFFGRDLFNWNNRNFSTTQTSLPAVNIKETADAFEVEMAAPGMTKQDFRVELNGNQLTISCNKENREEKQGNGYTHQEFSYQSFQRMFTLPKDVVDEDRIEGKYENGLLHLTIPKREESKQKAPRRIEIG